MRAYNPFKLNMEKKYLTQQRTQTGHGDALEQYVRNWSSMLRLHTAESQQHWSNVMIVMTMFVVAVVMMLIVKMLWVVFVVMFLIILT